MDRPTWKRRRSTWIFSMERQKSYKNSMEATMSLIVLVIVVLVVLCLVIWAIRDYAPIPQPFKWILILLVILLACWFILDKAGII